MNYATGANLINGLPGQPMPFPIGKQVGLRSHLGRTFKIDLFNDFI